MKKSILALVAFFVVISVGAQTNFNGRNTDIGKL